MVVSSSDMSIDMLPLKGFSSSGSSSVGKTEYSILISTGLNLVIFRVMVWSSFLAVIMVPFLATTSYVEGLYGVEFLLTLLCFTRTASPGWRFYGLAFILRCTYCCIRNFAAAYVSLMVLSNSGVLISARVVLMLLLDSAVADDTPVELRGVVL